MMNNAVQMLAYPESDTEVNNLNVLVEVAASALIRRKSETKGQRKEKLRKTKPKSSGFV